jgi:hypothetical protein
VSIGDRIWEVVRRLDAPALVVLLDGLDEDGLGQARAWYRRERKAVEEALNDHTRQAPHGRIGGRYEIRSLLMVWLGSPAMAARQVEWGWFRDADTGACARRGVWSHDRAWIEQLTEGLVRHGHGGYSLIREVVDRFDLPHPTTAYVVAGWLRSVEPRARRAEGRGTVDPEEAAALLRADPRTPDLWRHLLGNPELGGSAWVSGALARLARAGDLDRAEVVGAVVEQLTSPTRPQGQRVLTDVLVELDVRGSEVPGGLAMVQGLVATCHGRAIGPLLPLALELLDTGDDLVELCSTVTGRTEKKQRRDLLEVLLDPGSPSRFGPDAVRTSLELYAALDDTAIADRARSALGVTDAAPAGPDRLGLWELVIEPRDPPTHYGEIRSFGDSPVHAVHAGTRVGAGRFDQLWLVPGALSVLNRGVHREGADRIRRALGDVPQDEYLPGPFGQLVEAWVNGRPLEVALPSQYALATRADPTGSLLVGHLRETMSRLGRSPELLSTPTYDDGTLTLDDLVRRLGGCDTFGPLDLALALLRMRPVDPARASELEDLSPVPPDDTLPPTPIADAVAHARAAIAANGLRPPRLTLADLDAHGWLADDAMPPDDFWAACLPLDLEPFGIGVDDLAPPYPWGGGMASYAVAPHFPDLRIREKPWVRSWLTHDAWWQLWAPDRGYVMGTPGLLIHATFLREYAQTSKHPRAMALEATSTAIGAGSYHPDTALVAAEALLRLGRLNLARCSQAWEELFLVGGLRTLWPVALGTAAAACRQPRKPPGLPDLLRVLTRYAGEVPEVRLPDEITTLAAEKGSTKSHAEARALTQAVGA